MILTDVERALSACVFNTVDGMPARADAIMKPICQASYEVQANGRVDFALAACWRKSDGVDCDMMTIVVTGVVHNLLITVNKSEKTKSVRTLYLAKRSNVLKVRAKYK